MLSDFFVWVVIIGFALLLLIGIINGWFGSKGNFGALTSFHDFQPKDKQEAIEDVIEEKAGKQKFVQTSGDKTFGGEFELRKDQKFDAREDDNS